MSGGESPAAESVQILHITDPHLFADKTAKLRGTVSWDSLGRVLGHYQASGWQAERVVATGDIIQDDSAEAYRHFAEAVSHLGMPVHCVPGNHDVRDLMKSELADAPFGYCDAVNLGAWLLIGIDSCVDGRAGGSISA